MRSSMWILRIALLATLAVTACAPAAPAAKPAEGWPDTNAGRVARGWVEAFSAGEAAMRTYLEASLSQEALAKKPMDERMETYRTNRERYGKLTFVSLKSSKPSEVAVNLADEDGKSREFVFKVQDKAPFKLVSVTIKENRSIGHFGGGFHH
jgi:hypothetical protein